MIIFISLFYSLYEHKSLCSLFGKDILILFNVIFVAKGSKMNIRPGVKMFFIFSITFLILSVEKVTTNSDCSTAVASGSYNGVNACSNSQQNQLVKLINEVSFLLPGKRVESTIDICDDLKVMGKVSAATTVSASTINCDYSFVVLIIVNINGKLYLNPFSLAIIKICELYRGFEVKIDEK